MFNAAFPTQSNLVGAFFFSLNLWGFCAADAGGYAAHADSSKSAPTESDTCCLLSSIYSFLSFFLFRKMHINRQPDEGKTTSHTNAALRPSGKTTRPCRFHQKVCSSEKTSHTRSFNKPKSPPEERASTLRFALFKLQKETRRHKLKLTEQCWQALRFIKS